MQKDKLVFANHYSHVAMASVLGIYIRLASYFPEAVDLRSTAKDLTKLADILAQCGWRIAISTLAPEGPTLTHHSPRGPFRPPTQTCHSKSPQPPDLERRDTTQFTSTVVSRSGTDLRFGIGTRIRAESTGF